MPMTMNTHESLNWLVSSLFTDRFIEHPYLNSVFGALYGLREQQGSDTEPKRRQTAEERFEAVDNFIDENQQASDLFVKAQLAVKEGKIKTPKKNYDEWGEEIGLYNADKIESYSFYIWAEQNGVAIPDYLMKSLEPLIHMAVIEKNSEEQIQRIFPTISKDQFNKKSNEPLWSLANAILYLLGHRNIRDSNKYTSQNENPTIESFIKRSIAGEKLLQYAGDAAIAEQITLIGDNTTAENDEELLQTFVEPKPFIEWAKNLPLDLPILHSDTLQKGKPAYATPDMLLMYDAVEHFWSDYDLENPDPRRAPYKNAVVDWLMAEAEKQNIARFSKTRAEIMDTIMRCPKSRSGGNA